MEGNNGSTGTPLVRKRAYHAHDRIFIWNEKERYDHAQCNGHRLPQGLDYGIPTLLSPVAVCGCVYVGY
jgi:hypothetical protein